MPQIDSITALGRLLRDGPLRDAYATAPLRTIESLQVVEAERTALLRLDPADLEFQAQVLLRKRFETVSRLIPFTIANLGDRAWPIFVEFGRTCWPSGEAAPFLDVQRFVQHVLTRKPVAVAASEQNRIRFALAKGRIALHFVRGLSARRRNRLGLQFFLRLNTTNWTEFVLYFGL